MAQDKGKGKGAEGAVVTIADETPQGALSAADVAALAGAAPKAFRRWMRDTARAHDAAATLPGKGRRYGFTRAEAEALAALYVSRKGAAGGTHAPAQALLAALGTPETPQA